MSNIEKYDSSKIRQVLQQLYHIDESFLVYVTNDISIEMGENTHKNINIQKIIYIVNLHTIYKTPTNFLQKRLSISRKN